MSMLGKIILIKKDQFMKKNGEEVIKPISSLSNTLFVTSQLTYFIRPLSSAGYCGGDGKRHALKSLQLSM
jgi:hypothetical protein